MFCIKINAKPAAFPALQGIIAQYHIDLKIIRSISKLYNKGHGLMYGKSQSA